MVAGRASARPGGCSAPIVVRMTNNPAGGHTLPPVKGGFVGRGLELNRVGALLMGSTRVVTLIGSGGIGKTLLAEEAVRRLHRVRRTPVFVVRLAGLPSGSDAAVVRDAVAGSVLVDGFVGASAWDVAVRVLSPLDAAGRVVETVLLMDNCEHVLAGAGAVVADLLEAVPGLRILATSREPLGWIDEQLVTVPPLSAQQSLELFRQRAELAGRPIIEAGQLAVAQQICERMHGHPLFIWLAAARTFYEPLPMILEQLSGETDDRRMRWRHGPRVGLDGRHRTISDVIAWSYELCDDKQRLLFDRLSVFAPGYDVNPEDAGTGVADVGAELEAIEVVCADDVPIGGGEDPPSTIDADQAGATVRLARSEIRELLNRLAEQSLISRHMTADSVRYFLLESLRLFAADRLAERSTEQIDETAKLVRRHYYYYRDMVLYAQSDWFGPAEQKLLKWATGAWSNIRRAIDISTAVGKPVVGLQIGVGVLSLRALFLIGSYSEIQSRIERALAATPTWGPALIELKVLAMAMMASLTLLEGRPEEAEELLERCVAACDADAARTGRWRDNPETYTGLPGVVDYAWGIELLLVLRDARAIAVLSRAREKFRSIGHRGAEASCEMFQAMAAAFLGSAEQAIDIGQRHLEHTTEAGAGMARSWAQMALAIALTKHGDVQQALQLSRDALAYLLSRGDRWGSTWAVHVRMWSLAQLITDQNATGNPSHGTLVKQATEIAYLAGGVKTQRARLGMVIDSMGPFGNDTRTAEKVARDVLGQEIYADIENRGAQLSAERFEPQQIALGLLSIATSPGDDPAAATASSWQTLSAAQQEVAILAAAGWPNSAIGVRRGTSTKTIDAQMSSIFQKLMINSREDIFAFVPRDQRNRVSAEHSGIPHQSRDKPRSIRTRRQG